jgi:type I restriction enzyme S subunit
LLADAPNGVQKLRELILQLAVQGKLVPQDPNDEPASILLERIEAEKKRLVYKGKINKEKNLPSIKADKVPFELPDNWVWCHLGEIIQISSGDALTSSEMVLSGQIPVYGGNGITGYHNQHNADKPTLVIGRVGYYCGSVHLTPNKAWITDNAFITYFSESNIDIHFLYWLLKGTDLQVNNNATAQPVISGRKVYPIIIGLPPLPEQHRIVAKVDRLWQDEGMR